jgi:hypothetical protein
VKCSSHYLYRISAILLLAAPTSVHADKLLQGALLCPLKVHQQLSDIAGQQRTDGSQASKAHNLPLNKSFNQIVSSECVTTDNTVTVTVTGKTWNKTEDLSEVIFQGRRLWVDTSDLALAKRIAN